MRKYATASIVSMVTAAALLMFSTSAMAGGVSWSISVGAPVYYAPPVIYSHPQIVYGHPQVMYQTPTPIVRYRPQPYVYADPYRHDRGRGHHQWRKHRGHHRSHHDGHHRGHHH